MKTNYLFNIIISYLLCQPVVNIQAQPDYQEVTLTDKTAFVDNAPDWKITGNVWYNPFRNRMKEEGGAGVIASIPPGNGQAILITKKEHGNLILDMEFMLAPHASTTVFLQGRYGIRLTDSWTDKNSTIQSCGTILSGNPKSEVVGFSPTLSIPPRNNLARAPGLWQHLRVVFESSQFDINGNKTSNARLLQVTLNGVLIQEDITLPDITPSAVSQSQRESQTGPLVFSTDSRVAFKNIRYASFESSRTEKVLIPVPVPISGKIPLIVTPVNKTVIQRCFLGENDRKMTVCAVVGEPGLIHYGINLEQGSIIRLWKGDFFDATTMWESRGTLQLARPLGSVISTPSEPQFAKLTNDQASWPEIMQPGYTFNGYFLDKQGRPTFNYTFGGIALSDRTIPSDDSRILTRTLQINDNAAVNDLWIRLAAGDKIEKLEEGLYAINDKSYYIRLNNRRQRGLILRKINEKEELLISGSTLKASGLTWSYIW